MSIRLKKLDKVRDQVIQGYENNMSLEQIAELNNVSKGTVRNFLMANNVTMKHQGRKKHAPVIVEEN